MKIRGIEMNLHHDEDLSNHIRRENDFFEADILDYLKDYHPVQETILDIGANIGNHAVYFANFLKYSQLICFEPLPENFKVLISNLTGKYKNFEVYQYAASDKSGTLKMAPNTSNMGASRVDKNGSVEVRAITIDRMNFQNVTLMKIDVENYEPFVLEGAKDTIFRCHPLILIEDWDKKYTKLLPDYEIEKAWDEHKTYLYKWRENA